MIVSTAPALEGRRIVDRAGFVPGQAGACAAVGVDLNYAVLGEMVSANGTAVVVR